MIAMLKSRKLVIIAVILLYHEILVSEFCKIIKIILIDIEVDFGRKSIYKCSILCLINFNFNLYLFIRNKKQ